MEKERISFVERINGVTFIISMKSDDNAKKSVDDYLEDLITRESLDIEPECA